MKRSVLTLAGVLACMSLRCQQAIQISDQLQLIPVKPNVWMHRTTVTQEPYGTFTCNGMVYIRQNQAIIADTPPDEASSNKLLSWLVERNIQVKAVIVNHYHWDCLGGLTTFHEQNIQSYGHALTPQLASADSLPAPQYTFSDSLVIDLGTAPVIAAYLGPAHSTDNLVVYLPQEKVLFGGCMIKAMGSGKGYLGAADLTKWSHTVQKVKQRFEAEYVIPGHGSYGGQELLDYTMEMFREFRNLHE
ncbi:MAG: subclass B1 metallo-beta-lactamase [Cyclobacteriaceae bacterium]|nr:subclass B1 metallo-beta-lactamase [Cyclobacteriaceae bacterium]